MGIIISSERFCKTKKRGDMNDFLKCNGVNCNVKNTCYRFSAPPSPVQSWISPEVRGKDCAHLWLKPASRKRIVDVSVHSAAMLSKMRRGRE